jgi:hypothetical protein
MYKNSVLLAFIAIFVVVYGPVLDTPLGAILDISFLCCLLLVLLGVLNSQLFYLDKFISNLLIFLFLIFIFSLMNTVFLDFAHIEHSSRAVLRPIRVLLIVIGIAIFAQYFTRKNSVDTIALGVMLIFIVILSHSMIMIFQFFNEGFKDVIYQYTTAKYVLETYQATRLAGLSGAGGAQLSIVQSFGLILGVYLFVQSKDTKNKIYIFTACQFILGSIFLSGRSGFLTAFIFCPLYFLYLNSLLSGGRFIKNIILASITLTIGLGVFSIALYEAMADDPIFMSVFNRIFDTFVDYNEGGEVNVDTLTALSEMFILPNDVMHLLFGKASYLNNNTLYDIFTDIGYFRLIWGYGIIGSLFHYGFYLYSIYVIHTSLHLSKAEKSIPIILLLLTLFFNIKEILIFTRMSFPICMLVLFIVYFTNKRRQMTLEQRI